MVAQAGNPLSYLWNMAASPIYGIGETAANIGIPGAESFLGLPVFSGVEEWRGNNPEAALGAEVASYLIPFAGWAGATRGGLGAMGALTRAGARLGGSNNALRFAAGETARYLPLNAAITGFDAAGGEFDSFGEGATSFLLGQGAGIGLGAAGASQGFQSLLRQIPIAGPVAAAGVRNFLGPSDAERVLYGFGPQVQQSMELRNLVSQFDQSEPYQLWGRRAIELLHEVESGNRTDIKEEDILNLLDYARTSGFSERVGTVGESYVNLPYPTDTKVRRFLNKEFTPTTQLLKNQRHRQFLVRDPGQARDYQRIEQELSLPPGWEFYGRYFRHIQTPNEKNAQLFRRYTGLAPATGKVDPGFRRVERHMVRTEADGTLTDIYQPWSIRQENDGGWIVATELPQPDPKAGPRFLMFKTDAPDQFFPADGWRHDMDNPNNPQPFWETLGAGVWNPIDDLPETVGPYFDNMRRLSRDYLNVDNFQSLARSSRAGGDGKQELLNKLSGSDQPPGFEPGKIVESYLTPTMFQFRNSPRAAQLYQSRRAMFDAAEAWKQEIVYGKQGLDTSKSIWGGVFGKPQASAGTSLYSEAKRLLSDPKDLEQWRQLYLEDKVPLEQWPDSRAKEFQTYAVRVNQEFIKELYTTLGALKQDRLKPQAEHMGIGHNFSVKGSNYYAVVNQDNKVAALGTGNSAAQAQKDALEWIEWRKSKGDTEPYRMGGNFTADRNYDIPKEIREQFITPGFFNPQGEIGGYRWEREQIKNVDELIEAIDKSYAQRTRLLADRTGMALTAREHAKLLREDPTTAEILNTRLNQLKGVAGPLDVAQNRILDKVFSRVLGTNSASKIVEKINEGMTHLAFGMGNIAYPILNMASIVQNSMPELVKVLASTDDQLVRSAYWVPTPGANGKARGVTAIWDAAGSMRRGFQMLSNPKDWQREIFDALQKSGDLDPRFAEEYLGQNASQVARLRDVRSPEDGAKWLGALSSWMPAQTEKLARAVSAAVAIDGFEKLARMRGKAFTHEQMVRNVQNFVRRTNYLYSTADRPAIFTAPGGALFGSMKNWLAHYIFTLGEYTELAMEGNAAPLFMSLAGTAALGGGMALPLLGPAADLFTETFEDKDILEYTYANMGSGANAVAFGLPGLLGASISGSVSAPGAKFLNDVEFLASVPAWERMSNMARAVGTGWDDAVTLGIDPWENPTFKQQMMQGFSPRSFYRAYDMIVDDDLNSAATGYARVQDVPTGQRWMMAMGFTPVDIERENAIYDHLRQDTESRREMTAMIGEAYFMASANHDQDQMEQLLRLAAVRGIDQSSVLRSAARRGRDAGVDMFGRLRGAEMEDYTAALEGLGVDDPAVRE